jgi:hypothetical protein
LAGAALDSDKFRERTNCPQRHGERLVLGLRSQLQMGHGFVARPPMHDAANDFLQTLADQSFGGNQGRRQSVELKEIDEFYDDGSHRFYAVDVGTVHGSP